MSVPRNFYIETVLSQVLTMMQADLAATLDFDLDEPTYVGRPEYVANYPCLISVPSFEGVSAIAVESPHIGQTSIKHTVVYLYQGMRTDEDDFVDPHIQSIRYGEAMLDWLAYANLNDRLPLVDPDGADDDTNWAAHFYGRPWVFRVENEYQASLREVLEEEHLFAPSVEFTTVIRNPFS